MQRSNAYILIFTLCTTIFVGGTLALTAIVLKPRQERAIDWDTKTQILSAVIKLEEDDDVLKIYNEHIVSLVVDHRGNELLVNKDGKPIVAEKVNVAKNYKLAVSKRKLPIFKYMTDKKSNSVEAYILPIYGNGLWDRIWGFVALDVELETIKGIAFGHKGETPGLGARIADDPIVRARFKGKKIYDKNKNLVSVTMIKGETGKPLDDNHVDGLSGATMTSKGVNNMLKKYLDSYEAYFKKIKSEKPHAGR